MAQVSPGEFDEVGCLYHHYINTPLGLVPLTFYPSYQLSAVRIGTESGTVAVEHQAIEKPSPGTEELTLTVRLLTLGRKPDPALPPSAAIPAADTG